MPCVSGLLLGILVALVMNPQSREAGQANRCLLAG